MHSKTHIKLGGITNLSDARFAASAGIHYIGFCFDPSSPHYLPPIKAKEMMDWISGSHLVAEFGNQTLNEISDLCSLLPVDVVEVENNLSSEELKTLDKAIIKKINTGKLAMGELRSEMHRYHETVDAFHLYGSHDELPYPVADLKNLCSEFKIIWGMPLTKDYVQQVIDAIKPYAINLTGGDEEKPGIRDFDELSEVVDLLIPLD